MAKLMDTRLSGARNIMLARSSPVILALTPFWKTLLQGEPQPKLEKLILIDDSNIDALHKQTSLLTTLAHSPYCNMIAVIIFSFEMLLIKALYAIRKRLRLAKVYFIYNDINSSALASTQKQDAGKHRVLQGNGLP